MRWVHGYADLPPCRCCWRWQPTSPRSSWPMRRGPRRWGPPMRRLARVGAWSSRPVIRRRGMARVEPRAVLPAPAHRRLWSRRRLDVGRCARRQGWPGVPLDRGLRGWRRRVDLNVHTALSPRGMRWPLRWLPRATWLSTGAEDRSFMESRRDVRVSVDGLGEPARRPQGRPCGRSARPPPRTREPAQRVS